MTKNTKIAIVVISVIAIVILALIYTIPRLYVHNVFDEIYHSYVSYFMTNTQISNIENVETQRGDGWHSPKTRLSIYYDEEYLRDKTDATIRIYPDNKILDIWLSITFFDSYDMDQSKEGENTDWIWEDMTFFCEYNTITKTLTLDPLAVFSSYLDETYPDRNGGESHYEDEASLLEFFELHGVTKEDLDEYKDYILNEVIIGSWVEGNKGKTRFSSEDPGDFIVIDNSYQNLGEEWQD